LYKENQRHQHYGGHLSGNRPQCQSPARSGGIQHTRNPVSGKGQGRERASSSRKSIAGVKFQRQPPKALFANVGA
ncbi:MAG: hypothetical protein ABWY94_01560, partial [Pseudoxanthomonas sp.]